MEVPDYSRLIDAAGGWAMWINEKGLVHGHLRARHSVRRARKGFERIVGAIRMMAKGRPRI